MCPCVNRYCVYHLPLKGYTTLRAQEDVKSGTAKVYWNGLLKTHRINKLQQYFLNILQLPNFKLPLEPSIFSKLCLLNYTFSTVVPQI